MWSLTIAHHDGGVEQHVQGDAAWRRLFAHEGAVLELDTDASSTLLFVALRRPGVRVLLKRDMASSAALALRPGRFYQVLNKNALVLDGAVYVFGEGARPREQGVEGGDGIDVQATVPYDANERDDEDNLATQLYEAPLSPRRNAAMEETQPYNVDTAPSPARRAPVDATQLYDQSRDEARTVDATQLYDQGGAETRAHIEETQLYDQGTSVTRRREHVDETQLYDQGSTTVTRRTHVDETQLYDQGGTAVTMRTHVDATQLYDQGVRGDEDATQLYDAHSEQRPMRPPPPRRGSLADQTQLYDQRDEKEKEREREIERNRKRRREEEEADALETMIYDEDSPEVPAPVVKPRVSVDSPWKHPPAAVQRRAEAQEEKVDDADAENDVFDAIAKRALGVAAPTAAPSFTLHMPTTAADTSDKKSRGDSEASTDEGPQSSPFEISPSRVSPTKKRMREEEEEERQEKSKKVKRDEVEKDEMEKSEGEVERAAKRPRRGQVEEKEKKKGKEKEKEKEKSTEEEGNVRRSRRPLKPSALIMESQMGADLDLLPEMYRDAKKRAKEEKPHARGGDDETEEAKFAKVSADAEREVLKRRVSDKSVASQEDSKKGRKRSASTTTTAATAGVSATPVKGHIRPPSPPPLSTPRARPTTHDAPLPSGVAIVFSGLEAPEITELSKMATELGARVVSEVQEASHLVTRPPFKRTVKLLSAIVHLRPILDASWLLDSQKSKGKSFLASEKYILKDRAAEREFDFSLSETQRLWREEERGVFEARSFYITKKTRPSPSDLKALITAGGGKVLPTAVAARAERPRESCFVISCDEDVDEFAPLLAEGLRVCSPELIMSSVLQHRFEPDDEAVALKMTPTTKAGPKGTPARGRK